MIYPDPCCIQVCAASGLCNRLRAWYGIGALADATDVEFFVWWQPGWACNATFAQLFKPYRCTLLHGNQAPKRSQYPAARLFKSSRAVSPAVCFEKLCSDAAAHREFVKTRRRELQLIPPLQQRVDVFMAQLPVAQAIGVHIRRTDLTGKGASDQRLYARLDNLCEETPAAVFVVCADNTPSVMAMRKRYGTRVIWREQRMRRYRGRHMRCSSVANAAVDLYTLARTTRIIGTRGSSFSRAAAKIYDIPFERI